MLKRAARDKPKSPKGAAPTTEPFTYIHRETVIEGGLRAKGRVRIHGRVHGTVDVDGVLEVAREGRVEAQVVRCTEIRIVGEVHGDVEASERVEIWSGGLLEGDVRAPSLDIEEGATFIGRSEMRRPEPAPLPPGDATRAADPPALEEGTDRGRRTSTA